MHAFPNSEREVVRVSNDDVHLLACGASRSQFDVLNHAGLSLSDRSILRKIKTLGQERLEEIWSIAKTHMWNNLNFAFRVAQHPQSSMRVAVLLHAAIIFS